MQAAEAGNVCEKTVRDWYRKYPDYRAQVAEALDEYAATAGHETHNALVEHVRAAARGDMVLTKEGTEGGKPVEIRERVALSPAVARLILTRADARFTHPVQKVEHEGALTLLELVKEEAADGAGRKG